MDADNKPLGTILDALGVVGTLQPGQQIVEALIICKVIDFENDNQVSVLMASSDGLDWIAQLGLIAAAKDVASGNCEEVD